ncbi:12527_t:CDS:1, partial [Funneliformis mosseae]
SGRRTSCKILWQSSSFLRHNFNMEIQVIPIQRKECLQADQVIIRENALELSGKNV